MPPERGDRRAFSPATWPHGVPRTAHVDFLLRFVIERSTAPNAGIAGRLDAFERTLASLTRAWRTDAPIAPARELRLSGETLSDLLAWIEGGEQPDARELERLGVYASGAVTDHEVPEGWVRVRLAV